MPKPVILTVDNDRQMLRAESGKCCAPKAASAALDLLKQLRQREHSVALFLVDQRPPQLPLVVLTAGERLKNPEPPQARAKSVCARAPKSRFTI